MEANNDHDKLDKFVRDAFEGYEELPSGDMWDRIDAGLPSPRWSWTRYRWSVAAACAIVLLASGLICQHLYYKEKIQVLSKTRTLGAEKQASNQPNVTVAPFPENIQKIDNPSLQHETTDPQVNQAVALKSEAAPERQNQDRMVSKDSPDLPTRGKFAPETKNDQAQAHNKIFGESGIGVVHGQVPGKAVVVPHSPANLPPGDTSTLSFSNGTSVVVDNAVSIAAPADASTTSTAPNKTFSGLAALPNGLYSTLQKNAAVEAQPMPMLIKPSRALTGWYLGLQVAPSLSIEKVPESNTPLPPWGGGPRRPNVVNERQSSVYTTDAWLKVGKKLNRNIALESGIGFRSIERSAKHRPAFEFRDGHPQGGPHGGGGHSKDFKFDYQLDAYGGTASVSLRMTQVDSALTISDKEPIGLEIKTIQRAQLLRIPLLASFSAGKGRLKGSLKVGLVGSFVLKNELEIEGLNCLNKKFNPEAPSKPKQDFASPKKFIPGYWVSAAAEYRLNRRWSTFVEPAVTGDFSAQTTFGRALPRDISASLNFGLHYYF